MYPKIRLWPMALVLFLPVVSGAQNKTLPLNFSVFNESTAIPFTRFFTTPVHPGLQLGTEFKYNNNRYSGFSQTANICYFYHNYLSQGIGLYTELGYEFRAKQGFALGALLGLGYTHTFATTEEFTFTNGHYKKKPDRGNARISPSFSLDIGYYLKKANLRSPKIFIRYQSWIEYPFSPGFIPLMTHINLHVGTKLFITKKQKNVS